MRGSWVPLGDLRDRRPGAHVLWLVSRAPHPSSGSLAPPSLAQFWVVLHPLLMPVDPLLGRLDVWLSCCPEMCTFDRLPPTSPPLSARSSSCSLCPLGFLSVETYQPSVPPTSPWRFGAGPHRTLMKPVSLGRKRGEEVSQLLPVQAGHGNASSAPPRKPSSSLVRVSSLPPWQPCPGPCRTWMQLAPFVLGPRPKFRVEESHTNSL